MPAKQPSQTINATLRPWTSRCFVAIVATVSVTAAGCSSGQAVKASTATTPATTASGPLQAPAMTPAMDGKYLEDIAAVDPALGTYLTTNPNVAPRALLTDGSAFCAFLVRGGGIDNAMASLVVGANGVESQTHLPQNVTTYNAIDAVALVVLCPKEKSLLPTVDRLHIDALTKSLGSGGA